MYFMWVQKHCIYVRLSPITHSSHKWHSFTVKLEMISVYSIDLKRKKKDKRNKANWGNKRLVEEKCKDGKDISVGGIKLCLENRESKLDQQGEVRNNTA